MLLFIYTGILPDCSSVTIHLHRYSSFYGSVSTSVQSMSIAMFHPYQSVVGCSILVDICDKQWIVVTRLLAMTYAKRCIGFGWAKALHCMLKDTVDPASTKVKAASMLIHLSPGKASHGHRTSHKE